MSPTPREDTVAAEDMEMTFSGSSRRRVFAVGHKLIAKRAQFCI